MGTFDASPWLSLVRFANKRTRDSRALRRLGVRAYCFAVRANTFLPPPKVLMIGPPKSGTHLLSDCLSLLPKMMFSGRHFALPDFFVDPQDPRDRRPGSSPSLDVGRLRKYLARCPRGMFVTAHARFHRDLLSTTEELQFRRILLLRDPRDVAVSRAFYLQRDTLHHHHKHYTETLKTDEERLMVSIRGFENQEAGRTLPSIGETFSRYLAWIDDPATLVVRFEDLVGARGGGDTEKQLEEIGRIGAFVGRPLSREQVQQIAQKMYGKGSLTFRKGQMGDWRNHFTEAHERAFKEVAGDILARLGYESDDARKKSVGRTG